MEDKNQDHFKGKDAHEHIAEKKNEVANEIHGDELPGHVGAILEASRDTAALFMILWTLFWISVSYTSVDLEKLLVSMTLIFVIFAAGWLVWKFARSAWTSWAQLERLHRVLKEERYEIENNREQEREELTALYAAKGFKGELLEDVIDVLMADDERLLKIMMEEEMGLNMENLEHPVKVGVGAAIGVAISSILLIGSFWLFPAFGLQIMGTIILGVSGIFIAKLQKNEKLNAFIWNTSFGILIWAITYFLSLATSSINR